MTAATVSRRAGAAVFCAIAVVLVVNVVWIARNWHSVRPLSPGDPAPAFALRRIDDGRVSNDEWLDLARLRGDVVLVDFWAEWCGPCRKAMPAIEAVYQRYRGRGFHVISVKTDGRFGQRGANIDAATSFPIVADTAGVAGKYKVTTIPHLVLVDHRGIVRFVHRGYSGVDGLRDDLDRQIQRLLERRAR